jgi:hypothetical protein
MAALVSREETVRRLLLMAVDAAGGSLMIPAECARRVTTMRMSLSARELPAAEGGGTLLQLEVKEAADAPSLAG